MAWTLASCRGREMSMPTISAPTWPLSGRISSASRSLVMLSWATSTIRGYLLYRGVVVGCHCRVIQGAGVERRLHGAGLGQKLDELLLGLLDGVVDGHVAGQAAVRDELLGDGRVLVVDLDVVGVDPLRLMAVPPLLGADQAPDQVEERSRLRRIR